MPHIHNLYRVGVVLCLDWSVMYDVILLPVSVLRWLCIRQSVREVAVSVLVAKLIISLSIERLPEALT